MDRIDVLVARAPQALEEPGSFRIASDWILKTTILEKNGISARFFNVDFLRKLRPYQYPHFKEYEKFKEKWKYMFDEKNPKWRNTKRILLKYEPKILFCIPAHIYNVHTALFMAKLAKKLNPNIKVIISNVHPYLYPILLKDNCIDCIIKQNEDTEPLLVKICKNFLKGGKLNNIPNLVFKNNGGIVQTKEKLIRIDLNSLPIPDRELVIDKKFYPPSSFGHILGGRGCGYQCQFCVESSPIRLRDPKLVVREIAETYIEYKTRDFAFDMTSFFRSKKWALETTNLIKKNKLDILWISYANAIEIDEENVKAAKSSGCWKLGVGFESGSERILRLMKKPLTLSQALRAAQLIKKYGIFLYTGFIIGYPGERREDILKTLKFIRIIKPDMFVVQIFVPHPSVRLLKNKKIKLKDENFWEYSISQVKFRTKREEELKNLWKKYFPLTNLCERIIFRKIFLNPKFFLKKGLEYIYYITKFI
jgi:radical SAM superfamily enzyme YgiQ (UPF0313 family)